MYGSRHYSEDQLFISPQTNIAGQLSPSYLFRSSNELYNFERLLVSFNSVFIRTHYMEYWRS